MIVISQWWHDSDMRPIMLVKAKCIFALSLEMSRWSSSRLVSKSLCCSGLCFVQFHVIVLGTSECIFEHLELYHVSASAYVIILADLRTEQPIMHNKVPWTTSNILHERQQSTPISLKCTVTLQYCSSDRSLNLRTACTCNTE